jgi:hypothetical protein
VHDASTRNPTQAWFRSLSDAATALVGVRLWAESGHPDLTPPRQLLTKDGPLWLSYQLSLESNGCYQLNIASDDLRERLFWRLVNGDRSI